MEKAMTAEERMALLRKKAGLTTAECSSAAYSSEEKAKRYNGRAGNLEGHDCPKCLNKGHTMMIKDGYEYMVECECMEIRRNAQRLKNSGLEDMVAENTFDAFEVKTRFQETMKAMALEFCNEGKGWFFIGGQPGSGKTHICTAITKDFMDKGKAAIYMLWLDEVTNLKAIKMNDEDYERAINRLKTAPVLYIDDFFKTQDGRAVTAADVHIAFEILNYRYNNKGLVTIISSEKSLHDLIDIDEALGSRVYQKCGKFRISIGRDPNKNYRLKG